MRPAASLRPGDVLDGKYLLHEVIGHGGMGSVFRAEQPDLARTVAIKVLHPEYAISPVYTRRLRNEASAASWVRSARCASVIEDGTLPDGAPYLVMEHVPGRSLGQVISDDAMPVPRAVELMTQALAAIAAVHDAGVIHGDIKSDNFLVERVDGADRVTLIDFGLARLEAAPVCPDLEDGEVMVSGTPEYMAPEVICGGAAVRASDLYSAGVILYELLTGAPPFTGPSASDIMVRHVRDAVVPPSQRAPERDIPPALDRVVLRALHKRPEQRHADAASFARELRAAAATPSIVTVRPRRRDRSAPAAPTADWGASPRRHIARGSDRGAVARAADLQELCCVIGGALAGGSATEIADGYLALAGALGRERRFAAAERELLEGIELLRARQPDAQQPIDRLITAIAAVRAAAAAGRGPTDRRGMG
jgi:eukaryotic-like serine/threonine-protein kinase